MGEGGVLGWPCRVGFIGPLLQIIDDKGNSLPLNTEGYIGISMKPTKPTGLFMGYDVSGNPHLPPPGPPNPFRELYGC